VNDPLSADLQEALEIFRRYLRERSLPVTTQREQVAERNLHVGKATIYRTLDLLAQSGMVHERDFGEGFRRYERAPGHPHHEHLICLRCGKVVEFANEKLEKMKELIAAEYGFQHRHHRLEIYGVCRECQQREAAAQPAS
jgi:Fur family ferric uptake transcriptional regulator